LIRCFFSPPPSPFFRTSFKEQVIANKTFDGGSPADSAARSAGPRGNQHIRKTATCFAQGYYRQTR
jgi:hypothetical protein